MTLRSGSSPATLDWKFSQVFGERSPGEDLQNADLISAIEFDKNGDYLAVGDRGGRVMIFEANTKKDVINDHYSRKDLEHLDFTQDQHPEFQYKTEFQSHEPEFDYLKSLEIEEKISNLEWCGTSTGSLCILSTNDKTIKLWKVRDHKVKKVKEMKPKAFLNPENALLGQKSFSNGQHKPSVGNGFFLEWTDQKVESSSQTRENQNQVPNSGDGATSKCRKVYAHAHDFHINSISSNSDYQTFLSADDLRINIWNLEVSDQCFNIVDLKPSNMDDLTEVITSAEFHPRHCNLLAYSSSRGFIRLVDMRQSAICDQGARILKYSESRGSKSLFTEIIAAISDIKFTNDGRHILSRDYMTLKLWDVRKETTPAAVYKIHEHLRPKITDLYNEDLVFDKFDCCISGDGLHFATGSYSNQMRFFSYGATSDDGITIEASKKPYRKANPQPAPRSRRRSLSDLTRGLYRQGHEKTSSGSGEFPTDLKPKLLHLAWNPKTNLIACGSENSLFIYYA